MTGLPFTREAFLDVFAAYDAVWWPLAVVLWLSAAAALVHVRRRDSAAFALAMRADVMLLASGVFVLVDVLIPRRRNHSTTIATPGGPPPARPGDRHPAPGCAVDAVIQYGP